MTDRVLAIDIGGTKLAVGLVDDAGALVGRRDRPTDGDGPTRSGDAVFADLRDLVDQVLADAGDGPGPIAVGVGCGGPMTAGGVLVSPLSIPAWTDFPLRDRLHEHLALPVTVDNDAKALALGEGWVGAARGVEDFVALVVSTGVGGGIVLNGRLLDGHQGNAGHIGHVIVEPDGAMCLCGAQGCLEAEASGSGIARATGRPAEEASVEIRRRTGQLVGRTVASVANLVDLRLAVVAGSVALGYGSDFFGAAQDEIERSARLDHSRGTRIVPGALGPDGPVIGAGAVAWRSMRPDFPID